MMRFIAIMLSFLIFPASITAENLELELMIPDSHNKSQHTILGYFKKLVEERSDGRISIQLLITDSSAYHLTSLFLEQDKNRLILVATNSINDPPKSLVDMSHISYLGKRENFYHQIDTCVGCLIYTQLKAAGLELLGIWDSGRVKATNLIPANRSLEGAQHNSHPLPEAIYFFNTYILIMPHEAWQQLSAELKIIIHEAIHSTSLYAFEIAEQYDLKHFPESRHWAPQPFDLKEKYRPRISRSIDASCLPLPATCKQVSNRQF